MILQVFWASKVSPFVDYEVRLLCEHQQKLLFGWLAAALRFLCFKSKWYQRRYDDMVLCILTYYAHAYVVVSRSLKLCCNFVICGEEVAIIITSLIFCAHKWQEKEQANKYAQQVCNYQLSFIIIRLVAPAKWRCKITNQAQRKNEIE